MVLSFSEGFLLGLGAAIPLGPINILIMNESIKRYKSGVIIGLGAMSSDIVYLLLIMFGLVAYVNRPEILNLLSLFGGLFLLYLSYTIYKNKEKKIDVSIEKEVKRSSVKLYIKGLILTFINPYTVGFWFSASGYIVAKELDPFATMFGMLSAIFLWITIMPYLVHRSRHRISQGISRIISYISSLLLFGFGIMMLLNLF